TYNGQQEVGADRYDFWVVTAETKDSNVGRGDISSTRPCIGNVRQARAYARTLQGAGRGGAGRGQRQKHAFHLCGFGSAEARKRLLHVRAKD
ncbi:hypothetical protein ACLOJK_039782, partial [Asimina triloba]